MTLSVTRSVTQRFATLALAALLSSCAARPGTSPAAVAATTLPDLTSYVLMRTDAGARVPQRVTVEQAADVLADYDVIFLGEAHEHPANHLAEMALLRAIYARAPK